MKEKQFENILQFFRGFKLVRWLIKKEIIN
jgi:hypothetical protein